MGERGIGVVANMIEWVTVEKFCELSGYTPGAVSKKTAPGGAWKEGEVWKWGDDGRKLIHIGGFNRWVRTCEGRPSTRGRKPHSRRFLTKEQIERFWSKVDTSGECWEWTASRTPAGYGKLRVQGRDWGAHQVSYRIHHGPIPDGHIVMHRCQNKGCVRPDHLAAGTYSLNLSDAYARGERTARRGV